MYPGQISARVHAVVVGDDGATRSRCEGRPLEVQSGIFNPMADNACRDCCTSIRHNGDPRMRVTSGASR